MSVLIVLFLVASVATFGWGDISHHDLVKKAENFKYDWKLVHAGIHGRHHFVTAPAYSRTSTLEGTIASSTQNGLFEANATARVGDSHIKIEAELDLFDGFFTVWSSGKLSGRYFARLLRHLRLPPQFDRVLHGAEFKECLALQTKIDKNLVERMVEHAKLRKEYVIEHTHYTPCYVDGIKGKWIGVRCFYGDFVLMDIQVGHLFLKFSHHHEWFGPLAPRPRCANVVRDARLAAPALQFMTEALPDSEFKTDAQQLIAHMSEGEHPRYGVWKMPLFVGMLAGISVISVIAGFVIGQRS